MDSIDVSKLPLEVRAKLAELDLEISEGKCFAYLLSYLTFSAVVIMCIVVSEW